MRNHKHAMMALAFVTIASILLAACAPAAPVEVPVTVVVKETQQVNVEVPVVQTQIVEVQAPSYSKPHPILSDLKVRQAIAFCTNRAELIQSVYTWLPADQQANLFMDTNIPGVSWAHYTGPETTKYDFDAAKGMALLEEAGWSAGADAPAGTIRSNANGDRLSLKFTTTTAAFRKTWSAVFVSQMKACGLEILALYAPASWWFGSSTGLRHRDFELGAYAWVGETDPKGQTLYACNQIPTAENGWAGQNYMGWCNKTASDAINAANNSLVRADRVAQYKIFQIEFTKDMVSLPVFQRAEGNAATLDLINFRPSATEYFTWNADQWELADGRDTLVTGQSQEPASMYTVVESSASQRFPAQLVFGTSTTQVDYDFQASQANLATVESGAASNNDVEVKEGDPVVDSSGTPTDADGNLLTLTAGLKIKTADGQEVEYAGGAVTMKQLVVSYTWQDGLTWSDGEPVVQADFELAYKNDCDPTSGAVDYSLCQSIQSVEFNSDTEYTVTYKPGYQAALYFLPPIGYYPSHQVLSDGRKLNDVPTAEWASLKEIAETPLGAGPYILTNWEKGVKMEFVANPFYYKGEVKIKNITISFVQDTQQAVAQLLTGEVDVLDSSTLGAGDEVQTVLDNQDILQVHIVPSATWEHIDMNLNVP
ncbi:MAG: peptide ABC transporter substrate-binding protein [Chloroflexi bacterium]|nr:peptide ABC transporter substrate-binding protein [Chloroflexota bacterium]